MTDGLKPDFFRMLNVLVGCVEALNGKKVAADLAWQADAQPIATKLFFHLGSLHVLQEGTSFVLNPDVPASYVDFPSVATLARAALETYLTFHFIFVQPATTEEKRLRHSIWRLGGLRDRQRFIARTPEGKERQRQEREQIEKLEAEITTNESYGDLSEQRKKDALKGKWRLGKKWEDLAELTGIHKDYFVSMYSYVSSHAHTGYIGVLQLSQAMDKDIQQQFPVAGQEPL